MFFTEYQKGTSRSRRVPLIRSEAIEELYRELSQQGVHFDATVSEGGDEVTLTAEKETTIPGERVTLAFEIADNGPDVPEAIDRLIRRAWERRDADPSL